MYLKIHLGFRIYYVECMRCGVRGPRELSRNKAVLTWQQMNKGNYKC